MTSWPSSSATLASAGGGLRLVFNNRHSVRAELARGELVVCGGAQWHVPLEIRLYRCALVRKANVRLLWRKLEGAAAQATGNA